MYVEINFLSAGGENLSVFVMVLTQHLSSVQRAQVPLIFRESRPCPMCSTELTKSHGMLFFPTWKEGKSQGK